MGKPRVRGNGDGSVYAVPGRRKPWAASIVVAWKPDGRPIRRARYASSEREAKALLAEMVAAKVVARPLPDDRLTVGKWLNLWLARVRTGDYRAKTVEAYERSVRILLPVLGSVPLRRLRSRQVTDALIELRARYTPHSIAAARTVLSTAIKDAMREGHVTTNEASLARAPKVGRTSRTAPDADTVKAILRQLEGHRLRPLYVLLAGTGLRIGEATGLRWEDIADGTLTVRYQLQRIDGEHVLTDPKTDSAGMTVGLPGIVREALRVHRVRQAEERIAAGRRWRPTDLVFTTTTGQPIAESTAQWVLSEACKAAGVRHVAPHDLRRFAATELDQRLGREAAQRVLRHVSGETTEGYISRTETLVRQAAEAMQEALG